MPTPMTIPVRARACRTTVRTAYGKDKTHGTDGADLRGPMRTDAVEPVT